MSFSGKVAIVTGASSGIGAATAIALAREGAKVVLVARNEEKLNKVANQCEEHGTRPLVIKADVAQDEDAKAIVKITVEHFRQIDILINNAGIVGISSMLDEDIINYFDLVMNTNVRATVLLTTLAVPHLIKTKGNIVNMSSIASLKVPGKNYMCYAVSKAAMDHFTRCCALDFAPFGVRVNSVNPGPVKTDIVANAGAPNPDVFWERFKQGTALKNISEPEETADLVLFLVSDKARSITGSSFVTDNVANQCEEHGTRPLVIKADVTQDEDAKTIVKTTVEHFGQIDILINNAGIVGISSMLDEDIINYFDLVMNTNVRATVLLTTLAVPHLIKTKGNIVNMSSIAGLKVPGKNYMCYAVSKAAVDHFTRCSALDFAQFGVRVNSVNPGPVKTDIVVNAGAPNPDVFWEKFKQNTALKNVSEPEETADLILFLGSDKARSITGSSFITDNGMLLV